MRDNKHGKQPNENAVSEKNSRPPGQLHQQKVRGETELPGSVDDADDLAGGQPQTQVELVEKTDENEDWDYDRQDDDDDFEEEDVESPDEYDDDDYLEDGYEDDRNKDYPEDYDLEYLKQFEEADDHPDDDYGAEKPYKSPLVRIVALVTVLAFLGLALAASWPVLQFPLAELVGRSIQLQKDIDVQRLQAAVVQIDVVSRQGASIAAERKSGTGFNIRPEGFIVTNHHVIDGALNMTITFPGGKIYKAQSWASKPEYDLAVIRLQGENLPVVPINESNYPAVGDKIRVVGNPLGLNNVVVDGEIDGYLRVKDNPDLVISINAPVYPGNSGSPVFNKNSEVVGVVFARYLKEIEGQETIFGLAVPIDAVLDIQTRG